MYTSAQQQELEHLTCAKEVLHTEKGQVLGPKRDGGYSVRKKIPTVGVKKANDFPEHVAINFFSKDLDLYEIWIHFSLLIKNMLNIRGVYHSLPSLKTQFFLCFFLTECFPLF